MSVKTTSLFIILLILVCVATIYMGYCGHPIVQDCPQFIGCTIL